MTTLFSGLRSVRLNDRQDAIVILDQTKLPNKEEYIEIFKAEDIWEAIYKLKVRGAPAIGVAAGYGLYVASLRFECNDPSEFYKKFSELKSYLGSSRPTAVNLFTALDRIEKRVVSEIKLGRNTTEIKTAIGNEAKAIDNEDVASCKKIGEYGLSLLKPGMTILTHCNAGHLAVSEYGTALSPIYLGQERCYNFKVYADETRPLLQGARLTAYELNKAGIDVTLICDNMASIVMSQKKIDAVLVGSDTIALNGDAANKIGTSGVAIMAKYYGIPFYVLAPTTTINFNCTDGSQIKIEERPESEITDMWYKEPMAPHNIKCYNPAFDVTPNSLITAIITEKGIFAPNMINDFFAKDRK